MRRRLPARVEAAWQVTRVLSTIADWRGCGQEPRRLELGLCAGRGASGCVIACSQQAVRLELRGSLSKQGSTR